MPALIDDPSLLDRVLRTFRIKGKVQPFELSETAVPVFDIGNLAGLDPQVVTTLAGSQGVRIGTINAATGIPFFGPQYQSVDVNDSGFVVNPAAGALLVDAGAMTGFIHEIFITISCGVQHDFVIEWRNAADAANVATWSIQTGGGNISTFTMTLIINHNVSERIRVSNGSVLVGTCAATISLSLPVTNSIAN